MSALTRTPANEDFEGLPDSMRNAVRWMLWRSEKNTNPTKKPNKVPYYANGSHRLGPLDSPSDQANFATFDNALFVLQAGGYSGLGFALGPDGTGNHWQGVDLDHLSERPGLRHLAEDLPGYTETSPSGDGVHAIGYGREFKSETDTSLGIESYSAGRYFTVTGDGSGLHDPVCIADFVEKQLRPLLGARQGESRKSVLSPLQAVEVVEISLETRRDLRSALMSMRADNQGLWQRNGHRLKPLGKVGRDLFMEWSATSEKFDPLKSAKSWDGFKTDRTGYQAVFKAAQDDGWLNPNKSLPNGAVPADRPNGFRLLSGAELCALPSMRWILRGVLPRDGLAALYGPSGSGKSFLILDIAAAIAGGDDAWFGRRVTQCPVTYCALEGEAGMGKRVHAWSAHHKKPVPDSLRFVIQSVDLMGGGDVTELASAIQAAGGNGGLVILDTLNRAAPGADENSSVDMGLLIAASKRLQGLTGGLVLLVHHTGKDTTKGLRGHSSLYAALDAAIEVNRNDSRREWSVSKSKDDETGAAHGFKLEIVPLGFDDAGDEVTSCSICPDDIAKTIQRVKLPAKGNQKIALDTLGEPLRKSPHFGKDGSPAGHPCIRLDDAIEFVAEHMICDSRHKTTRAREAVKALVASGIYGVKGDWLWRI
jgi:hypothetical protein